MADGTLTSSAQPPSVPVDLRPLTTSELIDRGFALYRAHFTGFLLIALLSQIAPLLAEMTITALRMTPSMSDLTAQPGVSLQTTLLLFGLRMLAMIIVFGFKITVTFYIADAYLGKVPSVAESMKKGLSRLAASIWTYLLNMVLILLTFIFLFLDFFGAVFYFTRNPNLPLGGLLVFGAVTLLATVISIAPVLIVFMRLMLTAPALALEKLSGWKSVRRSASLVRYDPGLGFFYWGEMRLSFLLLPLFIIQLLSFFVTSLPLVLFEISETFRSGSLGQIALPPGSVVILSQILTFLAGAVIWPLYSIAITLFYYDVRIRREGFDLEFMAGQMGTAK